MKAVPVGILICDTCIYGSSCEEFPQGYNFCNWYTEIEDVAVVVALKTASDPEEDSVEDDFVCLLP